MNWKSVVRQIDREIRELEEAEDIEMSQSSPRPKSQSRPPLLEAKISRLLEERNFIKTHAPFRAALVGMARSWTASARPASRA